MSFVWARDSEGNEWGDPVDPKFHRNGTRKWHNHIVRDFTSNKEGYSGEPSSFVDIEDPVVANAQRKYEERNREGFRNNMKLVGSLIQSGVVMPTEKMLLRTVEKLKKAAKAQR